MQDNNQNKSGWAKLWNKPKSKWLLGIPFGAFLFLAAGVVGTAGFNTVMHATSTEAFCVNCHVPSYAAEEYHNSPHGKSRSGMDVACADCHVPKEFLPKMWRKITAMEEVFWQLKGDYNSPEAYADHKKLMQERTVAHMSATDSHTCRSCHKVEKMDFEKQSRMAATMHKRMMDSDPSAENYRTCIDCHKGKIAHDRAK
ncbi:NapC/NirT family cytochrome c [Ferrimonas marina]|uniref:Cytochrome c-type protein n=1 Tax=Ferrimonas marina TaxID=299255 RepID=A0A1M5YUQ5_9GAMM|nr:NapC/NirT family cytochrome c [Ferrimonas marina]SHI15560.1 NapC/NirT cytochrome c family, N-terminal region [Ferrimonas marina]